MSTVGMGAICLVSQVRQQLLQRFQLTMHITDEINGAIWKLLHKFRHKGVDSV